MLQGKLSRDVVREPEMSRRKKNSTPGGLIESEDRPRPSRREKEILRVTLMEKK